MSATPITTAPSSPAIDLASLKLGAAFFMGSGAEVSWYCEVAERRDDRIRFRVVNGGWSGTICANTGALLAIGEQKITHSQVEVIYTADLPKTINRRDYQAAIHYVEALLQRAASLDSPAQNPSPSSF